MLRRNEGIAAGSKRESDNDRPALRDEVTSDAVLRRRGDALHGGVVAVEYECVNRLMSICVAFQRHIDVLAKTPDPRTPSERRGRVEHG